MAFYQEVFLNEVLIIFDDEPKRDHDTLIQWGVDCSDWESFVESIQHKKGRFYCRGIHHSAATNWLDFSAAFKSITAAGGRVENEDQDVLMIYRRDKWDLPKGKVDEGETIPEAALREVKEECGVNQLTLGSKLGIIYHLYHHKGKWILKDTHWFKMQGSIEDVLIPQHEEDIMQIQWMPTKENDWRTNTYPSILKVMAW
jgi:8-oxo-dGTP pyrophosphatase MutT (NUDIX family)